MRQWINLVEKWDTTIRFKYGDIDVFRNPSRKEFRELINNNDGGDCRLSFCKNGDVLIFDAEVTHGDIGLSKKYKLQIDPDYPTAYLGVRWNRPCILLHHAYSFNDDFINDTVVPAILNNPHLRELGDIVVFAEKDNGDTVDVTNAKYSKY